eukprot:CAMPEP_0172328100 /NCGR_PEP_ID=MMETSP1058-20130122/60175_1 /TAXON_ID=83371 /ORGANISM="Detonula confervacea, Strain CCMP 353" /LENGTH=348 /DNA_ID=CAMNT_0013045199 /DNA_START=123 /DNA_END=1170 /DNA_ORIENTATION=+
MIWPILGTALTLTAATIANANEHGCVEDTLPQLNVPHCDNGHATATIDKRLGTLEADFPQAYVGLCYTDTTLELIFEAQKETSYLVNDTFVNNDPIWMKTVMEAFIATGDHDPTEYLEFEVAPNNVIWTGMIHNPNKDFTSKATAFIDDWETYPITSVTTKDVGSQTWKSLVSLPLTMFNVEKPEGTVWRMNFFRTYYADETSDQEYGAWNPNKLISFHQTPCFGKVQFAGLAADSSKTDDSASVVALMAAVRIPCHGAWNPNKLISFHQTPCFGKVQFAGLAADSSKTDDSAAGDATDISKADDSAAGEATDSNDNDWGLSPANSATTNWSSALALLCMGMYSTMAA